MANDNNLSTFRVTSVSDEGDQSAAEMNHASGNDNSDRDAEMPDHVL